MTISKHSSTSIGPCSLSLQQGNMYRSSRVTLLLQWSLVPNKGQDALRWSAESTPLPSLSEATMSHFFMDRTHFWRLYRLLKPLRAECSRNFRRRILRASSAVIDPANLNGGEGFSDAQGSWFICFFYFLAKVRNPSVQLFKPIEWSS